MRIFIILFYCLSTFIPVFAQPTTEKKIKVYFNNPVDTTVASFSAANYLYLSFTDTLISYLERADSTIDITMYSLNNRNIVQAINAAHARGIKIRVIGEEGIGTLYDSINVGSGNKMKSTNSSGIMHNKFIIIDAFHSDAAKSISWTGSTNLTNDQLFNDFNNIVVIQDQPLAKAYTIEFEEMWSGKFGTNKTDNTPHQFIIDGRLVELYFSPSDYVESKLLTAINSSDYEMYFSLFSFTREALAQQIEYRIQNDSVLCAGIVEDTASTAESLVYNILKDDMGQRLHVNIYKSLMHHKCFIADANAPDSDPLVITGSLNWSTNGLTKNDENTLIIHDEDIANQFYQEWLQRYKDNRGDTSLLIYSELTEKLIGENIMAYPNPFTDKTTITVPNAIIYPLSLKLYDLMGREIFISTSFNINKRNTEIKLEGAQLQNVIYFGKIEIGNYVIIKKIMKM